MRSISPRTATSTRASKCWHPTRPRARRTDFTATHRPAPDGSDGMTRIVGMQVLDIRFPTSRTLDGSDAMNPDPDYSAAYVILETDGRRVEGHGLTFTIGRGNELCCAALRALEHLVVGLELEAIEADLGAFWRHMTSDSQLRWTG